MSYVHICAVAYIFLTSSDPLGVQATLAKFTSFVIDVRLGLNESRGGRLIYDDHTLTSKAQEKHGHSPDLLI